MADTGLAPRPEAIDGELMPPAFTVMGKPHPLRSQVVHSEFPAGLSIAQAIGEHASAALEVTINGLVVPRALWPHCRPKAGTVVRVVVLPRGGGVKNAIKAIIGIILIVVGTYFGQLWLVKIGLTLLVSAAIAALIPPPPAPKGATADNFDRLESITGTSNQAVPYGPIPLVIGSARFYPPYAALPYTEILADKQYLRMLLDLGYGELDITDIKIGETPIAAFTDVKMQISRTPGLFSDDIFEDPIGTTLNDGNSITRTSQALADELSIDIFFQEGLFGADDQGLTQLVIASFTVEYKLTTSGTWLNAASIATADLTFSGQSIEASGSVFLVYSALRRTLRVGLGWPVTTGQYDVRVTRNATDWGLSDPNAQIGDGLLAVLRTIRFTLPSKTNTLKLALKIQASDQLNGVINQLSVHASQKIPIYDRGTATWSAPTATSNPAWIYHWLLTTSTALARHVAGSRMDLDRICDWADDCTTKGYACNGMVDALVRCQDLLADVLATGQASFAMHDGLYSVLMDLPQTVPIQHFTPSNSAGLSITRTFIVLPHALRVQFINPTSWQPDEIMVLDDLHSMNGLDARGAASALPDAAVFETMTLRYVIEPAAAWQLGRYQLAQGTYRPNVFAWTCDIEHLVCTRGDLVLLSHDVPEWGMAWGRIKALTIVSGHATQVTLDGIATLAPATSYSIRVRLQDGSSLISAITTAAGDVTVVDLGTPLDGLHEGDLFMLGVTGTETMPLLITGIRPDNNLGAAITAVEYSDAVYSYIASPPSVFISGDTGLPITDPPPPDLTIGDPGQVGSPPGDGGTTDPGMWVGIQPPPPGYGLPKKQL